MTPFAILQRPTTRRIVAALLPAAVLCLPPAASASEPEPPADALPLKEIQSFADVFEHIKRAYVEDVDDRTLLRNAMRGMISELDPHSAYLNEEEYQSLQESTSGEFGGIGIKVGMQDDRLTVITPIDDTPASRAGVMSQDVILRIDNTSTDGMPMHKAVELMRGEPGSELEITVLRDGEDSPRQLTLTRKKIQTQSVKHESLAPGYGYLRISQFQERTAEQAQQAIEAMQNDAEGGQLDGLVLDLRNNPGGVLQAAVDVADLFLDRGRVVYTEGRLDDSRMSFSATPATPGGDVPLAVLVNGGSASAAEIVAGALQDQDRGVIMGTDSFGKGSVQQVMPLGDNEGIKLTTALYYTPDGRSIQAQGIQPDVDVVRGQLDIADSRFELHEADLEGHLDAPGSSRDSRTDSTSRLRDDYQLSEALNLLKALKVVNGRQR